MRVLALFVSLVWPALLSADIVVPTRTIRAREIITASDLEVSARQ